MEKKLGILGLKRSGIHYGRLILELCLTSRQLIGSPDLTGPAPGVPTMPVHAEQ